MNTALTDGRVGPTSAFVDAVVIELAARSPATVFPAAALTAWVTHCLSRTVGVDRWPVETVAGFIGDHLRLGAHRRPTQDNLSLFTPESGRDGYRVGSSSLLQIVTDDRPYLVDSVVAAIRDHGWSTRHIIHPQVYVARDATGALLRWNPVAVEPLIEESWIQIEVYPPLGVASEASAAELAAAVTRVLADVRRVAEDTSALGRLLAATAVEVRGHATAADALGQATAAEEWERAAAVLSWLADNRLTLLGARDYTYNGQRFLPLPGTGLGLLADDKVAAESFGALPADPAAPAPLVVAKDSERSTVHRPILRDYIGLRRLDSAGRLVGERRFLGLFTSIAYTESVVQIPVLRDLYAEVCVRAGYEPSSHGARQLRTLMDTYPRDELFSQSGADLVPILLDLVDLGSAHYEVKVFVHPDPWGRTVSVLVYLPRDRYTTTSRERLQSLLLERFGGSGITFHAQVGEASLARLYFRVSRPRGAAPLAVDTARLEADLTAATRSWDDAVTDLLADWPSAERGVEFSAAYQSAFDPAEAVADLRLLNSLTSPDALALRLRRDPEQPDQARLKVFRRIDMALATVMPHLTALGLTVTEERPYRADLRGEPVMVYEFRFTHPRAATWTEGDLERLAAAFEASYRGWTDSDPLLGLVAATGLDWVDVTWLRALVRYLRQAGLPYSSTYMYGALVASPAFACGLIEAFRLKHDPAYAGTAVAPLSLAQTTLADRADLAERRLVDLETALRDVASLDHDRILRALIAIERAIVRANIATVDLKAGDTALVLKLRASQLTLLPQPRPEFELWVHSPRVEGCHLRFGPVARGGLRWSDRPEDFRTEILGLVKAQRVKNAVIVPVGAKGGFISRRAASPTLDRARWQADGQAAYREFVGALLALTDNLASGEPVHPAGVLCYDSVDPYLVVAADKGTATFSDMANAIALGCGFWLGDAFASGGSHGFDHKAMGITARGAWESTRRHLHELGLDPDRDEFTVVGIGDMSGDVFGNGMLLSPHLRLLAAFDHRHIFIDPDPDPAASGAERRRLFDLPRSSWADYDQTLISSGGGIYPRAAKSIPITPAARAALGLTTTAASLTPDDYIHALLQAPVDLLWNGGIGTYVKAASESHASVGDKANDAVRVDGRAVRARCAVEGGNLGWTQLGRIEYAAAGGRINTDFIDNSAGVDTSDYEVNIKILLADAIARGRLTPAERDALLVDVTNAVARNVLAHNTEQNTALADEVARAGQEAGGHADWIAELADSGYIDPALEYLPQPTELADRIAHGQGLTNPELATLLSWTKIRLSDLILLSDLPDSPFVADRLIGYFPARLRDEFRDLMPTHRLHREIVATVAVNRFVDSQGIGAYHRLTTATGAGAADVIRAQVAARSILAAGPTEVAIRRANLSAALKAELRLTVRRLVERGTRWLLHNRRRPLDIGAEVATFGESIRQLTADLPEALTQAGRAAYAAERADWESQGLPPDLAHLAATASVVPLLFGVVEISASTDRPLGEVARTHFFVREAVGIHRIQDLVVRLPQGDRWALRARASLRDEVASLQTDLTRRILDLAPEPALAVDRFCQGHPEAGPTIQLLAELGAGEPDLARLTVALKAIRALLA
jgi:glutamate dehydrogenase